MTIKRIEAIFRYSLSSEPSQVQIFLIYVFNIYLYLSVFIRRVSIIYSAYLAMILFKLFQLVLRDFWQRLIER